MCSSRIRGDSLYSSDAADGADEANISHQAANVTILSSISPSGPAIADGTASQPTPQASLNFGFGEGGGSSTAATTVQPHHADADVSRYLDPDMDEMPSVRDEEQDRAPLAMGTEDLDYRDDPGELGSRSEADWEWSCSI